MSQLAWAHLKAVEPALTNAERLEDLTLDTLPGTRHEGKGGGEGAHSALDFGAMSRRDEEIAELRAKLARVHRRLERKNRKIKALRERLKQAANADDRNASATSEVPPTFFLVGRGRSGTTWLMEILNAHPEILCGGEGFLFDRNFRKVEFEGLRLKIPVSSLYNAIAESKYLRLWLERSPWAKSGVREEHLDELTRFAATYFLVARLSGSGKRIVGDKTPFISSKVFYEMEVRGTEGDPGPVHHNGAVVLEEIARILPEAKIIHVVRDGRDVAVSLMHFMWNHAKDEGLIYHLESEELEKRKAYRRTPDPAASLFTEKRLRAIARGWKAEVGKARELGTTLLGERYAEVRYEDLLGRPEEEVGRLFRYLGRDASEETVRACLKAADYERRSTRKRGEEDPASSRHRKGVSGDWERVFTEHDRRVFEEEAGDLLTLLGYETGIPASFSPDG